MYRGALSGGRMLQIGLLFLAVVFFCPALGGMRRPDNVALYKKTHPTSTNNLYVNDGRRYSYYTKSFVTKYGASTPQVIWFYIDLAKQVDIDSVIVTCSESGYSTEANKFFSIWCAKAFSNKNDIWKNDMTLCATQGSVALKTRQVKRYKCENMCPGRYLVFTKLLLDKGIYINEVEVYEKGTIQNRALYQLASQGTYTSQYAYQRYGVDGLEGSEWSSSSCTANDYNVFKTSDYFAIDLGRSYRIFKMALFNRHETCCMNQLSSNPFEVRVAEESVTQALKPNGFKLCYRRGKSSFVWPAMFDLACTKRTVGRIAMFYVKGDYATKWSYHLCEIAVYAEIEEENIAFKKTTVKIDEIGTTSFASSSAVDGVMATVFSLGSCIQTPGTSTVEWWSVDLSKTYVVRKVLIFGRIESAEGSCTQNLGVAQDIKTVPDSAISASSYYRYYSYRYYPKSVRLSRNTYRGTDAWCSYYSSTTQWLQIDLGKNAIVTGFIFQSAYYYYYTRWFRIAYATGTGGFSWIKDEAGNTMYIPGVDNYYNRIRTSWLPKEITARKVKFYPKEWYSKPCFRVEILGCWDTVNELRNFKVQVAKTFDGKTYSGNKFQTCHTQKEPMTKGHHKFIWCKPAAVGRHVVVEKNPAKNDPLKFCEIEVYGQEHDGNLAIAMKTDQSSTNSTFTSSRAVDGNRDSVMGHGSCAQTTASSTVNWWNVDLGQQEDIGLVTVTSGTGSCETTMRNISILASDTFDRANFEKNVFRTCSQYKGIFQEAQIKTFKCPAGTKGRYLVLSTPGAYPLSICEVEVYPASAIMYNLAKDKRASQNSDAPGHSDSARLAVDGFRYTDPARGSMSLTPKGKLTWWSVDLLETYHVRRMVVVNRDDEKSDWLGEFQAVVSAAFSPHTLTSVPHEICINADDPLLPGEIRSRVCPKRAEGRYVIVRKNDGSPLSLCEVEVYGTKPRKNLAHGKGAFMNTDILTIGSSGPRATDGVYTNDFKYGSCSSTAGSKDKEWWAVNLLDDFVVESVVITNRGDCCTYQLRKFYVSLMDQFNAFDFDSNYFRICNDQRKKAGGLDIQELRCPPASRGRHVLIVKEGAKGEPLVLCEVEVYGKPAPKTTPHTDKRIDHTTFGPTMQSLSYYSGVGTSALAVDGKKDLKPDSSCAMTDGTGKTEWWNVDLKAFFNLSRVEVYTSVNASDTKIQNLTVVVSDEFLPEDLNSIANDAYRTTAAPTAATTTGASTTAGAAATTAAAATTSGAASGTTATTTQKPPTTFHVCDTFYSIIIPGQVIKFECPKGLVGRYVTILKTPAVKDPLTLCEVEAFGVLNKPVGLPSP